MTIKQYIPWWAKISGKIIISRLPVPFHAWRHMGIFAHGCMLEPTVAERVFRKHYERCQQYLPERYATLELGPGDSLLTALYAAIKGSKRTELVDVGYFISDEIGLYNKVARQLCLTDEDFLSIDKMLNHVNAAYHINGLKSLHSLPDNSFDFAFSGAVLEHVRLQEFEATIRRLFELQKPGGVASHTIDLQDHLSNSLNSLRFSKDVWESQIFAKSGFYTNRLRAGEIREIFEHVGYKILQFELRRWNQVPLNRRVLQAEFADLPDEILRVSGIEMIAMKPN